MTRTWRRRAPGVRTDFWGIGYCISSPDWMSWGHDWCIYPSHGAEKKMFRKADLKRWRNRNRQKVHKVMSLLRSGKDIYGNGLEHLEINKYQRTSGWLTW